MTGMHLFQTAGSLFMEVCGSFGRNIAQNQTMDKMVRKRVLIAAVGDRIDQQPASDQVVQRRCIRRRRPVEHVPQFVIGERETQERRRLQHMTVALANIAQSQPERITQSCQTLFLRQTLLLRFAQTVNRLAQKEWYTASIAPDLFERRGINGASERLFQQAVGFRRREWLDMEVERATLTAQGSFGRQQRGRNETRSVGDNDEQRERETDISQIDQRIERPGIDPVHILDDQKQWSAQRKRLHTPAYGGTQRGGIRLRRRDQFRTQRRQIRDERQQATEPLCGAPRALGKVCRRCGQDMSPRCIRAVIAGIAHWLTIPVEHMHRLRFVQIDKPPDRLLHQRCFAHAGLT